jgi:hypothetical protein
MDRRESAVNEKAIARNCVLSASFAETCSLGAGAKYLNLMGPSAGTVT